LIGLLNQAQKCSFAVRHAANGSGTTHLFIFLLYSYPVLKMSELDKNNMSFSYCYKKQFFPLGFKLTISLLF